MAHRSQCSSAGDNPLDPNYLRHHYREEYRLAIDALVEKNSEGYYEFLQTADVVDFLSRPEIESIKSTVKVPHESSQTESEGLGSGDDSSSDTYWPIHSDLDAPHLDLGWPEQQCFLGPTEVTTLVNPSEPDMPSIKEQARRLIKNAQQLVAVVMDMFTDVDIFSDILDAAMRGVVVYILLDEQNAHHFTNMVSNCRVNLESIPLICVRTVSGLTYYCRSGKSFKGQMKDRFLLTDCRAVLSGNYSFMWSFEKIHRCIAHLFLGQLVNTFDEEFRILFAHSQPLKLESALTPMPDVSSVKYSKKKYSTQKLPPFMKQAHAMVPSNKIQMSGFKRHNYAEDILGRHSAYHFMQHQATPNVEGMGIKGKKLQGKQHHDSEPVYPPNTEPPDSNDPVLSSTSDVEQLNPPEEKDTDAKQGLRDWRISSFLSASDNAGEEDQPPFGPDAIEEPLKPLKGKSLGPKLSNAKTTHKTPSESSSTTESDKIEDKELKFISITREESFLRKYNPTVQRSSRLRYSRIFSSEHPGQHEEETANEENDQSKLPMVSQILGKQRPFTRTPFEWNRNIKSADTADNLTTESISTKEQSNPFQVDQYISNTAYVDMSNPDSRFMFFKELAAKRKAAESESSAEKAPIKPDFPLPLFDLKTKTTVTEVPRTPADTSIINASTSEAFLEARPPKNVFSSINLRDDTKLLLEQISANRQNRTELLATDTKTTPTTPSESSSTTEGNKTEDMDVKEPKDISITKEESFHRKYNPVIQRSSRLQSSLIYSSQLEQLKNTPGQHESANEENDQSKLSKVSQILGKQRSIAKTPVEWSHYIKSADTADNLTTESSKLDDAGGNKLPKPLLSNTSYVDMSKPDLHQKNKPASTSKEASVLRESLQACEEQEDLLKNDSTDAEKLEYKNNLRKSSARESSEFVKPSSKKPPISNVTLKEFGLSATSKEFSSCKTTTRSPVASNTTPTTKDSSSSNHTSKEQLSSSKPVTFGSNIQPLSLTSPPTIPSETSHSRPTIPSEINTCPPTIASESSKSGDAVTPNTVNKNIPEELVCCGPQSRDQTMENNNTMTPESTTDQVNPMLIPAKHAKGRKSRSHSSTANVLSSSNLKDDTKLLLEQISANSQNRTEFTKESAATDDTNEDEADGDVSGEVETLIQQKGRGRSRTPQERNKLLRNIEKMRKDRKVYSRFETP